LRIIGIDPGLRHTGWGIVDFKNNKLNYIGDGRISPSTSIPDGERLFFIKRQLLEIISKYIPNKSAIEQIFVGFGAGSSLKLGMARGVSMSVLAESGLHITEIPPKLVKKTITGYGSASKQQIKSMIENLLHIVPKNEDSADALAIAISAHNMKNYNVSSNLQGENNSLDIAISKALLKEKNRT
jgi:crossover junction endodeoxyribonuclease RuvC